MYIYIYIYIYIYALTVVFNCSVNTVGSNCTQNRGKRNIGWNASVVEEFVVSSESLFPSLREYRRVRLYTK